MVGASLAWQREEKELDDYPQAKKMLCGDGYGTKVRRSEVSLDSFLRSQVAKGASQFNWIYIKKREFSDE